jgi:hypothetical protein
LATHLLASSNKSISAYQIHRMLGVTYKTAWFMCHRIRGGRKEENTTSGPLVSKGKTVEAEETHIGKRETLRSLSRGRIASPTMSSGAQKRVVVGLVERGGTSRMFHLNDATAQPFVMFSCAM